MFRRDCERPWYSCCSNRPTYFTSLKCLKIKSAATCVAQSIKNVLSLYILLCMLFWFVTRLCIQFVRFNFNYWFSCCCLFPFFFSLLVLAWRTQLYYECVLKSRKTTQFCAHFNQQRTGEQINWFLIPNLKGSRV